jgi:hypothetical protein
LQNTEIFQSKDDASGKDMEKTQQQVLQKKNN